MTFEPSKEQEQQLGMWFTSGPQTNEQLAATLEVQRGARVFAETILRSGPPCADRTAALRKLREATFSALEAIRLEGK